MPFWCDEHSIGFIKAGECHIPAREEGVPNVGVQPPEDLSAKKDAEEPLVDPEGT
jgi:hypothetical protein